MRATGPVPDSSQLRVAAHNPNAAELASGSGEVAMIPFFRDITEQDDELQVENAEPLMDNIITAGQMNAVVAWAWSIAPDRRTTA